MRNNKLLIFAFIASLVLNVTLLATAGYHAYQRSNRWVSPMGHVMQHDRFLFEELDLGPGQLKALKERTVPFRAEMDRKRETIAEKRKGLIVLMRAERPDAKAIDAAIAEISRMQEDLQRRITAHMLEVKASLDSGNQKKFLDLIESRMTGNAPAPCPPGG